MPPEAKAVGLNEQSPEGASSLQRGGSAPRCMRPRLSRPFAPFRVLRGPNALSPARRGPPATFVPFAPFLSFAIRTPSAPRAACPPATFVPFAPFRVFRGPNASAPRGRAPHPGPLPAGEGTTARPTLKHRAERAKPCAPAQPRRGFVPPVRGFSPAPHAPATFVPFAPFRVLRDPNAPHPAPLPAGEGTPHRAPAQPRRGFVPSARGFSPARRRARDFRAFRALSRPSRSKRPSAPRGMPPPTGATRDSVPKFAGRAIGIGARSNALPEVRRTSVANTGRSPRPAPALTSAPRRARIIVS